MNNQAGRSMVEMLGILAIIGLLSVAGIKGFSIAMNKHKANELLNDANKYAVLISGQILTGKTEPSIDNLSGTGYGVFENPKLSADGDTFSISLTGVDSAVCAAMKSSLGDSASMAIAGECGESLTLCFNADLSRGVSIENGNCVGGTNNGTGTGSGTGGSSSGSEGGSGGSENSGNNNTGTEGGSNTGSENTGNGENEGSGSGNENGESGTEINAGGQSEENSCINSSQCSGSAECVNEKCVCSLACSQQYTLLDGDSCTCVNCSDVHFENITDVPQACCEKPIQDGGIGGEWNQQNDNLCHCPGKDEYWSETQQQCLSPSPCPNPPCESECQEGQVSCNGSCITGDCCTNADCTGSKTCNASHQCETESYECLESYGRNSISTNPVTYLCLASNRPSSELCEQVRVQCELDNPSKSCLKLEENYYDLPECAHWATCSVSVNRLEEWGDNEFYANFSKCDDP